MSQGACCTCASLLDAVPRVSSSSEKPLPDDRQLDCCGRIICGDCIHRNPRFLDYCPYCQTSGRSPLPSRLKQTPRESEIEPEAGSNPPPYSTIAQLTDTTGPSPPPYTTTSSLPPPSTLPPLIPPSPSQVSGANPISTPKQQPKQTQVEKPGYTIHHLRHPPHPNPDTLTSLSLQYGIPARLLLQHNRIPPDASYLLAARHTLLVPTAYCSRLFDKSNDGNNHHHNSSLSPHPVEDEAERERKVTIRRWMVACKEWDYDTAVVYLEESGYDFAEAVRCYVEDCEWEREHPLERTGKGKGRKKGLDMVAGRGKGRVLLGWLKG
ncbi:hypothetical protein N657DRAFT_572785 [Parathielavia appendiculata]|uniref:LysM domain-containing protein n=1 Tax=Parathielavia appendiculata TaxID=2587402 RepID=A0AAN6U0L3_9PEZI|nr:hypothetical protein N657DRAFT_572785 [Parathielavia appendiculata]